MLTMVSKLFERPPHSLRSVDAIIASVPKPELLASAESQLIQLVTTQKQRSAERARILDRIIITAGPNSLSRSERERQQAVADQIAVEIKKDQERCTELRAIISQHRPTYAADLLRALRPHQHEAAKAACDALHMLTEAREVLDAAAGTFDALGQATALRLPDIATDGLLMIAESIVEATKEP